MFDDFEKGADGVVLSFLSETRQVKALARSLFSVIELSSDILRAADDCNDAGFLLPGSGVIDRETHLSRPLLAGVAPKNALDKELEPAGPAD